MKKILLIPALFLAACSNAPREYDTSGKTVSNFKTVENSFINGQVWIIEIDSCEYIKTKDGNSGGICHKGNCKNPIHWKTITR